MKVVKLSAVGTGHLYLQEIFLVLISIRTWIDPSPIVRPEGLSRWKMSNLPPYNLCTMPQTLASKWRYALCWKLSWT
jgi:hypothetical protein